MILGFKTVSGTWDGSIYIEQQSRSYKFVKGTKPISKIISNGVVIYDGYCIENEAVREFSQKEYYEEGYGRGSGETKITNYYKYARQEGLKWCEHPSPIAIETVGGKNVLLSTSSDFSKYKTYSANTAVTFVWNLYPQTKYYYKVVDENENEVGNGSFETSGTFRMLNCNKVYNLRDSGGLRVKDDDGNVIGRLAYGKLLRGSYLTSIEADGIDTMLNDLGVTAEIDLTNKGYKPFGTKARYYGYRISAYNEMLATPTNVGNVLKSIRNVLVSGGTAYVHCTYGADRTGSILAVIEAICGVEEDGIIKDWELTTFANWCYSKKIDQIELDSGEMRGMLQTLYNSYGGKSNGYSLKYQIINWLKTKVFASESDKGQSIIDDIKNSLVVLDE